MSDPLSACLNYQKNTISILCMILSPQACAVFMTGNRCILYDLTWLYYIIIAEERLPKTTGKKAPQYTMFILYYNINVSRILNVA